MAGPRPLNLFFPCPHAYHNMRFVSSSRWVPVPESSGAMRDAALTEEPVALVKALIGQSVHAYPFQPFSSHINCVCGKEVHHVLETTEVPAADPARCALRIFD